MRIDLTLLAAATAVVVSFLSFWSNPKRTINRLFLSLSLHAAIWLLCLGRAVEGGHNSQLWMRTTTAVGAFIPLHLWVIKEGIVASGEAVRTILARSGWWALVCGALAAVAFTQWFVPSQTGPEIPPFQGGYYAYILGAITVYSLLCYQTIQQLRIQTGVRRIELQLVLLGGSAAALAVILLMALRAILDVGWLMTLRPVFVLIFYSGTVVAVSTTRILDARQIYTVILQKTSLTVIVAAVAYASYHVLTGVMPEAVAFLTTTAIALLCASALSGWLDLYFHFYPKEVAARQAAFAAARRETRVEDLERAFLAVLRGWGQTDHALILAGPKDLLRGGDIELSGDHAAARCLRQLRWATPERLTRERTTPEREALGQFLREHGLGVLVIGEGPALTAFVGVGVSASRRPFTFPQVTQAMELASIIENALERAHFSVKAQQAEQLATVGLLGASVAHEIRNPLVTIKTFVQLLPQHYQDVAFREKFFRLISDEVGRIDRLTEQLLDLASPRVYSASMIELHPILRASLDLASAKATDKHIKFLTDFQAAPDRAFTDPSAAKQVMLNLCFNAIQAIETQTGERWVKISTRNTLAGLEMAVADSGPGIVEEIRARLFQPFHTTKSSGFGLGLAICSDILANLNASISVDPPAPGCGATFRVTFPCQPS